MNIKKIGCRHPVPNRYHESLYIGELDRRNNLIDFKIPPVLVHSMRQISEYKNEILANRVEAEALPMIYNQAQSFIILRPGALVYRDWLKEEIEVDGLVVDKEIELKNFVHFADVLYLLDPNVEFHWKWRVIMKTLHESGIQDQNRAHIFIINTGNNHVDTHTKLTFLKKRLRQDICETPVIVKFQGVVELALGIHHLHVPEFERVEVEYNTLMHAYNMTSVFAQ